MAKVHSKTRTTTEYELTLSQEERDILEDLLGASSEPNTYPIFEALYNQRVDGD